MIQTFFTSDTHFGHKNILEYEKEARPFSCLEEMHEVLIERWNSVVKPNDIVYHLGDFCFGKHWIDIAARLQGKKYLILGNHDTYPSALYLQYFSKLYGVLFWHGCVLSHMPVHPNGLGARWKLSVHGHTHSRVVTAKTYYGEELPHINYFNCSVEMNNLTPIHADLIRDRLKSL